MSYEKQNWIDHIEDIETGEVFQEGTLFTAKRMNHIEEGIYQASSQIKEIVNINVLDYSSLKENDIWTNAINQAFTDINEGEIFFPKGEYLVDDSLRLVDKENVVLKFAKGSKIKSTKSTSHGHIIGISNCKNIDIINPYIDGNNNTGDNGIGVSVNNTNKKSDNINIIGGYFTNIKRSAETGGGRAISWQKSVINSSVENCFIENCTTAFDVNGATVNSINRETHGIVNNIRIKNCEEAMSFYAIDDRYNNEDETSINPYANNLVISNILIEDCGRASYTLVPSSVAYSGLEGGVFTFIGGKHITLSNINIVNSDTYGKIGGLFKGYGYYIDMNNIKANISSQAIFDMSVPQNLLPINADTLNGTSLYTLKSKNITANNITIIGSSDYIIYKDKFGSTIKKVIENCKFLNIKCNNVTNITNNILANNGTYNKKADNSIIDIFVNDINIFGNIYDVWKSNNTITSSEKINYGERNVFKSKNATSNFKNVFINNTDGTTNNEETTELELKFATYDGSEATTGALLQAYKYNNWGSSAARATGLKVFTGIENSGYHQSFHCRPYAPYGFELTGKWNENPLILNNRVIWVDDSGNLRIKSGSNPTSDTDGVIIGTQG